MFWLVILTAIGTEPPSHLRSKAEIRYTMNRIDDLSIASLDAMSHKVAKENSLLGNNERYEQVKFLLYSFATEKLDITMPMNDIERSVIEGLAKKASAEYDRLDTPTPSPLPLPQPPLIIHVVPKPKPYNKPVRLPVLKPQSGTFEQLVSHYPVMNGQKGWHNTKDHGLVWGWKNSDGNVIWSPQDQPPKQTIYLQPPTIQLMPR